MPYFWFTLICLIWGSSFILMKRAVECLSPISVGAGRVLGGALVLALIFFLLKQRKTFRKEDLLPLAAVVVLGYVWPHSIQPELVARHGSAFVGMSVALTPLMTILVSIPILRIWPSARHLIGVIGALICMAILMFDFRQRAIPSFDLALAVSVPLAYSIANSVIRRFLKHIPPLELTLLSLSAATAVLLPVSLVVSNHRVPKLDQLGTSILAVVILGVVGTGIAMVLFNRLVQQQGPLFAAMTTNLVPIGALMWGHADGEQISAIQVLALIGVVGMVTYVQLGSAQPIQIPSDSIDSAS